MTKVGYFDIEIFFNYLFMKIRLKMHFEILTIEFLRYEKNIHPWY